jgi:fumarate hydratase class II
MVVAQNEREMHPRIAKAIAELKDAVAYMNAAPHDFGGHKADAIRASNEAITQLNLALQYRGKMDRR